MLCQQMYWFERHCEYMLGWLDNCIWGNNPFICFSQFRNLHNLEIVLRILGILTLRIKSEIAYGHCTISILHNHNSCTNSRLRNGLWYMYLILRLTTGTIVTLSAWGCLSLRVFSGKCRLLAKGCGFLVPKWVRLGIS